MFNSKILKSLAIFCLIPLSLISLSGCSSEENVEKTEENYQETLEQSAVDFSNSFFEELAAPSDESSIETSSAILTESQLSSLIADGEIEGFSSEEVNELIDSYYANQPLSNYLYFSENSSNAIRIQTVILLNYAQLAAQEVGSGAFFMVTLENVKIIENDGLTRANFLSTIDGEELSVSPGLVLYGDQWLIDGEDFHYYLKSALNLSAEE